MIARERPVRGKGASQKNRFTVRPVLFSVRVSEYALNSCRQIIYFFLLLLLFLLRHSSYRH